jgi:hypothetical protein
MSPPYIQPKAATLRDRERQTEGQVFAINKKISRLQQARADRIQALSKIRSSLARAILAVPAEPEHHEQRR